MAKARTFFYVCAGLLCLAVAYHLGATSATAQAPGNPVVAAEPGLVYTANGDAYARSGFIPSTFTFAGNVFSGPTPATRETWGGVKARYRPGATATPQDK